MKPVEKWWPDGLGEPDSAGGQNEFRYAYFAQARRLAVRQRGNLTLYDTGGHRISGVSQQQHRGDGGATFTSQDGDVRLEDLQVVQR